MKKNSQSLFLLIKSLTRNEKGYFKKRIQQNGNKEESNYILLFDAIDKQKKYNEEKIKKQFAGTKLGEHLHVSKRNLYWVIFKHLRTYYSHFSIEAELHDMFRDAEIMLNNNLHNDCRILLNKILKIATENEFFLVILEAHYFIVRIKYYIDVKDLELNHIAQIECIKKYENLVEYRVLRNKLELLPQIFDIENNKHVLSQINEIVKHPLLLSPDKALSIRAKSYYYSINSIVSSCYLNKDIKYYEMIKQFVSEFEGVKANHIAWFHMYVESVNLLLKEQLHFGKYSEFKITLNKLKSNQEKSPFIKVYAFVRSILNETSYFIKLICPQEGLELIQKHEVELEELKYIMTQRDLPETFPIYFNCSIICFMNEKYADALRWISIIEENKHNRKRDDLLLFVEIYRLIIHFEMNDFIYFKDLIHSAVASVEKHRKLFSIEELVVDFLKKYLTKQDSMPENAFKILKEAIINLENEVTTKKILQLFDFVVWADSKIQNRSFVEILKEKSKLQKKSFNTSV